MSIGIIQGKASNALEILKRVIQVKEVKND